MFFLYFFVYFFYVFLSLLLQCKIANSTLLSLLSFSYFITPYDAQAFSSFSALILVGNGAFWYCHTKQATSEMFVETVMQYYIRLG